MAERKSFKGEDHIRQQVDRSKTDKAEDVKPLDDKMDNKQVFESSCTGSSCTVSEKEENSPTEGRSSKSESDNGLFERESDSDVNSEELSIPEAEHSSDHYLSHESPNEYF